MIIKYQNDEINTLGNKQNNYIDKTTIPDNKIDIRNFEQQINETKKKYKEQEDKTKELYEKTK